MIDVGASGGRPAGVLEPRPRVVVASDKWRGSFSSRSAGNAIATGLARALPGRAVEIVEVADGGEGTVDAVLARAARGERRVARVAGPRRVSVDAAWASFDERRALIESAAACGHALLAPAERDPLLTTTRGVGELARAALDAGAAEIALALGGSATVDGGAGMAQALGFRLVDRAGRDLAPGGGALVDLDRIETEGTDPRLRAAAFEAWCDVTNPLVGARGAARVFGPQKGAGPEAVERLEAGLARLAEVVVRDLGVSIATLPSAGAAGGLGGAAMAFLGARLALGAERVLDAIGFDALLDDTDLVVTGEGRFDGLAMPGKLPLVVAARAARRGIRTVLVCGEDVSGGAGVAGLAAIFSGRDLEREPDGELTSADLAVLGERVASFALGRG